MIDTLGKKIAIFGASGQGREVADICLELGYIEIVFLVANDNEICIWPNSVYQDTPKKVGELAKKGFQFAIGIGSPHVRKIIAEKYHYLNFPNLIHPTVTFGNMQQDDVSRSKGIIAMAGARLSNNIKCGDFCLFNFNVTIGHDVIIENYVSIMAGSNVLGNVYIKEAAYIGAGSVIMHGNNDEKIIIGCSAVIDIGSIIVCSI